MSDTSFLNVDIKAILASKKLNKFIAFTKEDYEFNWHHSYLCNVLDKFANGEIKKLMVFMPPQHGKFLPYNTPVLTSKGFVNHIDLKQGDYIFGQDGKLKKVIANSGGYNWNIVEVVFQDGKTIKCAKEHLWKLKVKNNKNKRVEVISETKDVVKYLHKGKVYIDLPLFISVNNLTERINTNEKIFIKEIIDNNEIVFGNCIQVEDGMYLAGEDLIPTHNSEIVSRRLPAYMLGRNPNLKIAGVSYSHTLSKSFNRDLQRVITSKEYSAIFPETTLNEKNVVSNAKGSWLRNSEKFEIVGKGGMYMAVGLTGGLTGKPVDVMIIDDPVKDAIQGSSVTFQARNIEWYDSVVETRLHNNSQVILCMTRWDVDDLAGILLKREGADWLVISMPAICENNANKDDPRQVGEVMWENRHNLEKILRIKKNSNKIFNSLYQQNPRPPDDILIFANALKISEMPNIYEKIIGVDFGFSNSQTGICLVEIDRKNKRIYAKELYYNTGATNNTIANILSEYKLLCYCDSAEPKSVEELKVLGINALPAKKFPNSVLTQILYLQEFEIFYVGTNFDFERNHYQWQMGTGGYPINKEIDKYNHLFKALMYAVYTHLEANAKYQKESNLFMKKRFKPLGI